MGKIALSQSTSARRSHAVAGPTDVPFKYRGYAVDFDGSRGKAPEGTRRRDPVYGSRRLSHALIAMGLVDELRDWSTRWCWVPGDRLFGETQDRILLRLVEHG